MLFASVYQWVPFPQLYSLASNWLPFDCQLGQFDEGKRRLIRWAVRKLMCCSAGFAMRSFNQQVGILHHLLSQSTLEFGLPLQAFSAREFSFSPWFSHCCRIHLEPQLLAKVSFFAFFCSRSMFCSPLGYLLLQHNHWSQSLILGDMWNIFPFCSFKWWILGASFRSFFPPNSQIQSAAATQGCWSCGS